jgi:hypothetical protein
MDDAPFTLSPEAGWQILTNPACLGITQKTVRAGGLRMKSGFAVAGVLCLSIGLGGCEGSAAGPSGCSTPSDVARKVNALTDDLAKARSTGKLTDERAGEIAAAMLDAGHAKAPAAYCIALDTVRDSAGL